MHFYRQKATDVAQHFKTDCSHGLTQQQASERLQTIGPNVLPEKKEDSVLWLFISQFNDPLIYILLCAATIIFMFGDDQLDAFIISGVLCFNAILGTIQQARTRAMLAHLKKFLQPHAVVIRDGVAALIEIKDIVPGDLLLLQEGQRVPADARIIEAHNLQIDESTVTGESGVVTKTHEALVNEAVISDQRNMLFKGTHIVTGAGKAIVVATGIQTHLGMMYTAFDTIHTDIPLKRDLEKLAHTILLLIVSVCIVLFIIGLCMAKPASELLVLLTALFICVVPEGLPVVLTLVLTRGSYLMAKKRVLVKNMQAIEALGRTNVIIIDKTGTLTRNEMMVSRVLIGKTAVAIQGVGYQSSGNVEKNALTNTEQEQLKLLATAAGLLNNAQLFYHTQSNTFTVTGDPTEAALGVFAQKMGFNQNELKERYHTLYEIPFDGQLQYHAGFFACGETVELFIIGSPEKICSLAATTSTEQSAALYQTLLNDGLRVVAVAHKQIAKNQLPCDTSVDDNTQWKELISDNLNVLGFCGIEDTIRPEVAAMIARAQESGIRIVMATGDHQKTAQYVAQRVGIWQPGNAIIDGHTFEMSNDTTLLNQLATTTVFSRITPQQKVRLVQLFHQQNAIVAMTGDGVNDSLSLAAADLGIAMGNIGTEIATEAADLVLLDDSFSSIIYAIQQGRHIFYTLKRVILYFFSTNLAEILIIIFALLWELFSNTHLPLPLTAAQILWLNLITDGFLDMGLVMEQEEPNLLDPAWLAKKQTLIDGQMYTKMTIMALFMSGVSLCVFLSYYSLDLAYARTMTLLAMAMLQWFNAFNCRSMKQSVFTSGFFSNRWLILAASFVLFLQMVLLYTSPMQHIFKTVPLNFADWCIIIAVSSPILILEELRKYIARNYTHGKHS